MRILFISFVLYSASLTAEDIGSIIKDGQVINVVDTYSVFNRNTREITVHLLPCRHTIEFNVGWQPEFGFLKCHPISNEKYFSSPGASISIKFGNQQEVGRVILSTTLIGSNSGHDYQVFSKSWFRDPPIDGFKIKEPMGIKFMMNFDIPDESISVILNIDSRFDEIIKSNNSLNSMPESGAN